MNPWAGLIVVLAILLIIVAWKGTQDNVIAALLNRPYGKSTVGGGGSSGSGTSTTAAYTAPSSPGVLVPTMQPL